MKKRFPFTFAALLVLVCLIGSALFLPGLSETRAALAPGDKGSEVKEMQARLQTLGYGPDSVDGDYGAKTQNAVALFQALNDLDVTGLASEETLEKLFSDQAHQATAMAPAVEITNVSFGNITHVTVANNLDITVDSLELFVLTYNRNGEITGPSRKLSQNDYGMCGKFIQQESIRSGKTAVLELDIASLMTNDTTSISVCIAAYHAKDGNKYEFKPMNMYYVHSDGTRDYPQGDGLPIALPDADNDASAQFSLGANYLQILPPVASFYQLHDGNFLVSVGEESIFEQAGLRAGDVIDSLDGVSSSTEKAWIDAKLRMLEGEQVVVHYWRAGAEQTTVIAIDMDSLFEGKGDAPVPEEGTGTWTCSECGAENTGKFCSECGAPRPQGEWTCPDCGTVNKGNFCVECGRSK